MRKEQLIQEKKEAQAKEEAARVKALADKEAEAKSWLSAKRVDTDESSRGGNSWADDTEAPRDNGAWQRGGASSDDNREPARGNSRFGGSSYSDRDSRDSMPSRFAGDRRGLY